MGKITSGRNHYASGRAITLANFIRFLNKEKCLNLPIRSCHSQGAGRKDEWAGWGKWTSALPAASAAAAPDVHSQFPA